MKKYNAIYENQYGEIISQTQFNANNLKEANRLAKSHKWMTPEIKKIKKVKTRVYLLK